MKSDVACRQQGENMPRRRGRSGLIIIAATLVMALVLAAAFAHWNNWFGTRSHAVTHEAIGAGVTVTGGKVPTDLRATVINEVPPIAEARALGDVVRIEPGGVLPALVTIRFELAHAVAADAPVMVASRDEPGDEWQYQMATVSADGRYASIERDHLTDFWPFDWNAGDLFDKAKEEILKAVLSEIPKATKPTCGRSGDFGKDNHVVEISGKAAMLYCTGVEKVDGRDQRIVRITNNRNYPLSIRYPGLERPRTPTRDEIRVELKRIGTLLSKLAAKNATTIFPGETLTFTVGLPEKGGSARISSDYSGLAQSFHRMDIALGALLFIFAKMGGKGIGNQAEDRLATMDELLDSTECINAVYDLSVPGMIVKCFTLVRLRDMFDWRGVLLSPLTVGGAIGNWLQSEITSFFDQFNGRAKQGILIGRQSAAEKFIGKWQNEDTQVVFKANGTGTATWDFGTCNHTHRCTTYLSLKWRMNGDKLVYTYTSYSVKDETGAPPFDVGTQGELVGTSYTVTYVSTGLVREVAHDKWWQKADPYYLCGRGVSRANEARCKT
ncbi:hypothetical protein ABGB07_31955 [Micromonosporaceae bacterium B7E4]